jgi:hypothetical protein
LYFQTATDFRSEGAAQRGAEVTGLLRLTSHGRGPFAGLAAMALKVAAPVDLIRLALNGPRECREVAQAAVHARLSNMPELTFNGGDDDLPLLSEAGD